MPTRVSVAADLERDLFTAEEFLDWLTPECFADLINGEISMHSPVSIRHADLSTSSTCCSGPAWTDTGSACSIGKWSRCV